MRFPKLPAFDARLGAPGFFGAALLLLFAAYTAVLAITGEAPPIRLIANALANLLPIAVLGFGVRSVLREFVLDRPALIQATAHLTLAVAFSGLWFWLLMVLLGAVGGENAVQFSVRPFLGPAAAWQLFQGLTIYAMIAVACMAERVTERAAAVDPARAPTVADHPPRLFVKQDDEIRPLVTDRIILIRGADDYSEIVTATGVHLVRMTLAALDEKLGERFIRVHRSCLVNIDRIATAESAGGGRMLLHMETGEMIQASRAGSKLLRERVI